MFCVTCQSADPSLPHPVFLATFDVDSTARTQQGAQPIRTAESLRGDETREGNHHSDVKIKAKEGKYGGCLHFERKGKQVLYYPAESLPLFKPDWAATFSFWLQLNPDEDLAPGYCDPLQITSKAWNDAAIWVDFDKDLPRAFRMGAFPDYASWNPRDTEWERVAASDRPLIPVARPPFQRDRWTHVVMTIEKVNAPDGDPGTAKLFLDGQLQGELKRPFPISWKPEDTSLILGINYVGRFDELAIFDTALSPQQVKKLYRLPTGLGTAFQ